MIIDSTGAVWQKGGLHIHTTRSDGKASPEEAIAAYRQAGYDFIALTDHWKYGEGGESDGMTILSGLEYDVGGSDTRAGVFHIVAAGMEKDPGLTREDVAEGSSVERAQKIIDTINAHDGLPILCHPAWSLNRPEDIRRLQNLGGIEMFNAFSGFPWQARSYSDSILDILAVDGWTAPVHASDDSHRYEGEQTSSFIYVRSPDNRRENLLAALRAGEVYASQGPQLEVRREGNTLSVKCSPASYILFQTGCTWIPDRIQNGSGLTEAVFTIRDRDRFARVEVADAEGKRAWSGYYFHQEG